MSDVMEQAPAMGGEELDEETMALVAQLLQEGYTEDEIVEAILSAEEGGNENVEPEAGSDVNYDDDDSEEEEALPEAASAPPSKKPKKKEEKKKKDDEGYAKGGYVTAPKTKNRLAVLIGSLGRFG